LEEQDSLAGAGPVLKGSGPVLKGSGQVLKGRSQSRKFYPIAQIDLLRCPENDFLRPKSANLAFTSPEMHSLREVSLKTIPRSGLPK
jgi:hypothetical protein